MFLILFCFVFELASSQLSHHHLAQQSSWISWWAGKPRVCSIVINRSRYRQVNLLEICGRPNETGLRKQKKVQDENEKKKHICRLQPLALLAWSGPQNRGFLGKKWTTTDMTTPDTLARLQKKRQKQLEPSLKKDLVQECDLNVAYTTNIDHSNIPFSCTFWVFYC